MSQAKKITVVVGVSGGVDSSVSAYLLKQQAYQVIAVFMRNWRDDDEHCPATRDLQDARAVCASLEIPFHHVSFSEEYWDKVFQYFLDEYRAGRTPNPDILCNKEIKFRAFLDYAKTEFQADYIATGHYARMSLEPNQVRLRKAIDLNKDQTYFLYRLDQSQLANSLFPIGNLLKPEVRSIAKKLNLITHDKKDSTGICFIGERKFKNFLKEYLRVQPGPIKTLEGKMIGEHQGLMYYTIGQRQGIGIGGVRNFSEQPWYVVHKDPKENTLFVVQGGNHPALFKNALIAEQLHWINTIPHFPFRCVAKIRYHQTDQACEIYELPDQRLDVKFDKPQRAVTPGQSIVFYQDDICLGGGIIA